VQATANDSFSIYARAMQHALQITLLLLLVDDHSEARGWSMVMISDEEGWIGGVWGWVFHRSGVDVKERDAEGTSRKYTGSIPVAVVLIFSIQSDSSVLGGVVGRDLSDLVCHDLSSRYDDDDHKKSVEGLFQLYFYNHYLVALL
jgi:hypothetical protein